MTFIYEFFKKSISSICISILFIIAPIAGAQAVSTTYDFTSAATHSDTDFGAFDETFILGVSEGGIGLTITGGIYDWVVDSDDGPNTGLIEPAYVVLGDSTDVFDGIGITSFADPEAQPRWIYRENGPTFAEVMLFTFETPVFLVDVDTQAQNDPADFEILYYYDMDDDPDNDFTYSTIAPTGLLEAFGVTTNSLDHVFAVNSVTISDMAPSAIPLPAALPLYAAGLAILGLIGWRRKKQLSAA